MSSFEISAAVDVTEAADPTKALNLSVNAGATASTTMNLVAAQTGTVTVTLPDRTGTIATFKEINDVWVLTDEKASGTDGGTLTLGAWRTRDLQTLRKPSGTGTEITLNNAGAGPGIVATAGTYFFQFFSPSFRAGDVQLRLRNATDATTALVGQTFRSGDAASNTAKMGLVDGIVTIASTKTFEVQQQGDLTQTANGMGMAAGIGANEVYTMGLAVKLPT